MCAPIYGLSGFLLFLFYNFGHVWKSNNVVVGYEYNDEYIDRFNLKELSDQEPFLNQNNRQDQIIQNEMAIDDDYPFLFKKFIGRWVVPPVKSGTL